MKRIEIQEHSCDICVVGGGLAGCMAAIRAAELNDSVIHNFRVCKKLLHLSDNRGIIITHSAYKECPIPWLTLSEKNRL